MKRTWKIGECCKGGIISVDITESEIILYLKDWDFSKGSTRQSNQSNAKVLEKISINLRIEWSDEVMMLNRIMGILNDWTTYFYADQITNWIKKKKATIGI